MARPTKYSLALRKKALKMRKEGYEIRAICIYLNIPLWAGKYWLNYNNNRKNQKIYYLKNRSHRLEEMKKYKRSAPSRINR